ncbi:chromo domain-like protein, partial [Paraphysoderma sedebokerense]
ESSSPEGVFEIENILRHRKRGGVIEYRVKWAGYDSSYNQWVPEKDFVGPDLIDEYWDE